MEKTGDLMDDEFFYFTVKNRFKENLAKEEILVQVIPVHGTGNGGTFIPNTSARFFKLTSTDGYIIFKLKCLKHEIGNKDYIAVDATDKVQISVANNGWRLKIERNQSNDCHKKSPIHIEVGRFE